MRTAVFALVSTIALSGLVAGGTLYAHHAHPDFDPERTTTVTGIVERIAFQNPHVLIQLRAADSKRYLIEWQSAGALNEAPNHSSTPVKPSTFAPGDTIVVTGSPSRDVSLRAIAGVSQIYRPRDGWRWKTANNKE